ncbi:hypothetical protein HK102_010188, partial [Quaeritorhiza haematococci]
MNRVVGYLASWSTRPTKPNCNPFEISSINPSQYTHIIFAFGIITESHTADVSDQRDYALFDQLKALKSRNRLLRTLFAIGGWAFNDPPTQHRFSNMASSPESRATFISSVISFLDRYGFDGLDIDWEYPVAPDRGGSPEDLVNYTTLLSELRKAFGSNRLLTIAVPASPWYLRHFQIDIIHSYVDFFNFMTYDLHGTWDLLPTATARPGTVNTHTNSTEILGYLKTIVKAGAPRSKINLGLGFYGRSATLEDPTCTMPGCRFYRGGNPGRCTGEAGFLSYPEIVEAMAANGAFPIIDAPSSSAYTYFGDQWIGFDTPDTIRSKVDFARSQCLGGVMIWDITMDVNVAGSNVLTGAISQKVQVVAMELQSLQSGRLCNGLRETCLLRVDEVAFPSTHNSAARYLSPTYWKNGMEWIPFFGLGVVSLYDCAFNCQKWYLVEQLNRGIRMLDIDLMDIDGTIKTGHASEASAAADGIAENWEDAFNSIIVWAFQHPTELVVVRISDVKSSGHPEHNLKNYDKIVEGINKGCSNIPNCPWIYKHPRGAQWPLVKDLLDRQQNLIIVSPHTLGGQTPANVPYISELFDYNTWTGNGNSERDPMKNNLRELCHDQYTDSLYFAAMLPYNGRCVWERNNYVDTAFLNDAIYNYCYGDWNGKPANAVKFSGVAVDFSDRIQ